MLASRLKYNGVAMGLHWLIAALILTNYVLAWLFNGHVLLIDVPGLHGPDKLAATQWHKTLGISILLLSVLRLVWRLLNPPPKLSPHLAVWERLLAHLVHGLFYVFMIGMPLAGWAMVSASTRLKVFPINMFGLFNWPAIAPLANLPKAQMKHWYDLLETLHSDWFGWLGVVLIFLHVGAALKHQILDRDNELARMIPGLGTPGRRGIG